MLKQITLETLLKNKKINQRTFDIVLKQQKIMKLMQLLIK